VLPSPVSTRTRPIVSPLRAVAKVSMETSASPLELDATIRDPGAGWRLLHPGPVIAALIDSRS
jgi:hypothetical protein